MSDEADHPARVRRLYQEARALEVREGHDFRPSIDLERLEHRAMVDRVLLNDAERVHLEALVGSISAELVERARARHVAKALNAERQRLADERRTLKEILFAFRYAKKVRTDNDPSVHPGAVEEMEARFKEIDEELARIDKED